MIYLCLERIIQYVENLNQDKFVIKINNDHSDHWSSYFPLLVATVLVN